MRKFVASALMLAMLSSSSFIAADELDDWGKSVDEIWRPEGAASEDGAYTAISSSMIGWGLGLSAGIAILCAVLHQSTASSSHGGSCD